MTKRFKVTKGVDAYTLYAIVIEAETAAEAADIARSWEVRSGEGWRATGDFLEFDHADIMDEDIEELEAGENIISQDYYFLSKQQHSTVMAALRVFQTALERGELSPLEMEIATDSGANPLITAEQIDQLCEGMNY